MKSKLALITNTSSEVGIAVAHLLLSKGYNVVAYPEETAKLRKLNYKDEFVSNILRHPGFTLALDKANLFDDFKSALIRKQIEVNGALELIIHIPDTSYVTDNSHILNDYSVYIHRFHEFNYLTNSLLDLLESSATSKKKSLFIVNKIISIGADLKLKGFDEPTKFMKTFVESVKHIKPIKDFNLQIIDYQASNNSPDLKVFVSMDSNPDVQRILDLIEVELEQLPNSNSY